MKKVSCKTLGLRSGFSLLEVLFTVLILAVLAAVAVPLYSSTKASSAQSACKSNIQAIANAESKYKFDNGAYTGTMATLVAAADGIATTPFCPLDGTTAYTLTITGSTVKISCANHTPTNDVTLN